MKRFIINNNSYLFDIICFGTDKRSMDMAQKFIDVDENDNYTAVFWFGNIETFSNPTEERVPITVIDSFDTLDEVKEFYKIKDLPRPIKIDNTTFIGFEDAVFVERK